MRIETAWNAWVPQADFDGVSDFYGLQSLAVNSLVAAGEVFIVARHGQPGDAVPVQFQMLESEMLPQISRRLDGGSAILDGIEFDAQGRRVAYHFLRTHPGDANLFAEDSLQTTRIEAKFVSHVFKPDRPGQTRGASWLAPVLVRLRTLGDVTDAAVMRVQLANLFAMFITRPTPTGGPAMDPLTGLPVQQAPDGGSPWLGLQPGICQELAPGEDLRFSEPPTPGMEFSEFLRSQTNQIAIGAGGMPSEFLTGDFRDVSDRTLRVSLNEWRREVERIQWQIVIPKICHFMRDHWTKANALLGPLRPSDALAATHCEWTPPRHRHMHPVQDVQGLRLEIEAGLRSRASVIGEYGYSAADVDAERAADLAREIALGLRQPTSADPG